MIDTSAVQEMGPCSFWRWHCLVYGDGDVYEGEMNQGKEHGKGKMIYRNGVYEGSWKDDKKFGFGERTFPDGSTSRELRHVGA